MKQDYIIFTKGEVSFEKWISDIENTFIQELFGSIPKHEKMEDIVKVNSLYEISIKDVKLSSTKRVISTILYFFKNGKKLDVNIDVNIDMNIDIISSLLLVFGHINECFQKKTGNCWIYKHKSLISYNFLSEVERPKNRYERFIYNFYNLKGYFEYEVDLHDQFNFKKYGSDDYISLTGNALSFVYREYQIIGKGKVGIKNLVNFLPPHKICKKISKHITRYKIVLINNEGKTTMSNVDFLNSIIYSYDVHCENMKKLNRIKKSARK